MILHSLQLSLISILFYFIVATLTFRLERLKSHRLNEKLKQLGSSFFFFSITRSLFKISSTEQAEKLISLLKASTLLLQLATLFFLIEYGQLSALHHQYSLDTAALSTPLDSFIRWTALITVPLIILLIPQFLSRIKHILLYKALAPLASLACLLLLPISLLFAYSTEMRERQEDRQKEETESQEVKEGLLALIHDAESRAPLTDLNKRLLDGVFKLQERVAREIMVPRVEIFALDQSTSIAEATSLIIKEGKTRVPVYSESIDQIEGVLFAKDLLSIYAASSDDNRTDFETQTIQKHCKQAMFIPSTKRVSALLQDFRKKKVHLAIIVDEYGGTEGLITIEDILEELVGDISDEYDMEDAQITKISEKQYLVDAHMSILDINDQLNIKLPISSEYDSLSGFIFHKIGSIPLPKQVICQEMIDLEVVECSARSIEKVRVTVREEASPEMEG